MKSDGAKKQLGNHIIHSISLIEDTINTDSDLTNIGYLCLLACDLSSSGTKWQNYIPYNTSHYSGFHYDI